MNPTASLSVQWLRGFSVRERATELTNKRDRSASLRQLARSLSPRASLPTSNRRSPSREVLSRLATLRHLRCIGGGGGVHTEPSRLRPSCRATFLASLGARSNLLSIIIPIRNHSSTWLYSSSKPRTGTVPRKPPRWLARCRKFFRGGREGGYSRRCGHLTYKTFWRELVIY